MINLPNDCPGALNAEPSTLRLASCLQCRARYLVEVQDEQCHHRIKISRQIGEGSGTSLAAFTICKHCRCRFLSAVQDPYCPHRIRVARQLGDGSGIHHSALVLFEKRQPTRNRRPKKVSRPPLILAEPLWGPQLNEHWKRYEAALIYFELGPYRSFAAVSQQLSKTPQLIGRWAREDKWKVRAQAYDVLQAEQRRAVQARHYRDELKRQLKAYQGAQVIGVAGLSELMGRIERREPLDLSPDQILKFLDTGAKGARLVLGDPKDYTTEEEVTPAMVYERRLRDAVMDLRESDKSMPEVPLTERIKWAVEDYQVSPDDITSVLQGHESLDEGDASED